MGQAQHRAKPWIQCAGLTRNYWHAMVRLSPTHSVAREWVHDQCSVYLAIYRVPSAALGPHVSVLRSGPTPHKSARAEQAWALRVPDRESLMCSICICWVGGILLKDIDRRFDCHMECLDRVPIRSRCCSVFVALGAVVLKTAEDGHMRHLFPVSASP